MRDDDAIIQSRNSVTLWRRSVVFISNKLAIKEDKQYCLLFSRAKAALYGEYIYYRSSTYNISEL